MFLEDIMNFEAGTSGGIAIKPDMFLPTGKPMEEQVSVARQLKHGDHGCFVYGNDEERISFIVEYFGAAVAQGEKCVYYLHDHKLDDTLLLLEKNGLLARKLLMGGGLSISGCKDMFYSSGSFSPDEALSNHRKQVIDALAKGYRGVRILVDMGWAMGGIDGAERVMEFEARMNYFSGLMDSITVCQYHRGLFPPELIFSAMQTHPVLVRNGVADKNPYYLEPEVFLASDSALVPHDTLAARSEHARGRRDRRTVECVREDFRKSLNKYGLTMQEQRVVELALIFKSNAEMSHELFISTNTVKQHIKNIYRKMGISKRLELVAQFMKYLELE